jgi:hypothetical protein
MIAVICVRNVGMPDEPVIDGRRPAYLQVAGEPVFDVQRRRYLLDTVPGVRVQQAAPMAQVFQTIYRRNKWGSVETRSGAGSERDRPSLSDRQGPLSDAQKRESFAGTMSR